MSIESVEDDLTSGLETINQLDDIPPALRVRSVKWDSGMRTSGILPGDRIVAVNGKRVERPTAIEETQKLLPRMVGQYAEAQGWARVGLKEGASLRLQIRRRNFPGVGWNEIELEGKLLNTRSWRDGGGEPVMGPSGPLGLANDGFDGSWSGWHEQFLRQLSNILDNGLQQRSFSSRFELQQLLGQQARVDFLASRYPGPFSTALKSDFEAALGLVSGEQRQLTANDLDYRQEQDERVRIVAESARAAWEAFNSAHFGEMIQPFPAVDPVSGDRKNVAGKLVSLPQIGNENWIEEGHRTWFTFGNAIDGWYVADAEAPSSQQMLLAAERYRKFVGPNLPGEFMVIGRVLASPRLVVVNGRGVFGLQIEIVAALVGDAMFIDLSTPRATGEIMFTGEDQFHHLAGSMPSDSASPAEVMGAFIAAIKHGDQPLWKALFAGWSVDYLPDGRPVLNPFEDRSEDMFWEDSRRAILGVVYDAAPVWTGDVRPILTGKEFPLAPVLDEVEVEIEAVGLFDNQYRTFTAASINRQWKLQRRDRGPWRVSSVQNL